MSVKFSDLQCKEVICLSDGRRLGFVTDILVEVPEGKVCALVVPGKPSGLALTCREDYVIPWDAIRRIGPDIVLVEAQCDNCRVPRRKPGLTR